MSVNHNLLGKGIKQLSVLLLLLILSPISLNMAFKALKKTEISDLVAYSILAFSILLIICTIIFAFKTFKTLLDGLFNK